MELHEHVSVAESRRRIEKNVEDRVDFLAGSDSL